MRGIIIGAILGGIAGWMLSGELIHYWVAIGAVLGVISLGFLDKLRIYFLILCLGVGMWTVGRYLLERFW